ncbi:MAG TPA: EamA family transporter [Candidatus Polarisedimenticolia bacterium]
MRGVGLSLAAAAIYGILAPAAKGALAHIEPVRAAGLTYLAAGCVTLVALLLRALIGRRPSRGRITRRDVPRLLGMTLLGGVLGPVMFFEGVQRVASHHAAIVQHLEFAFTVLAAVLVLGERVGRRGVFGLFLLLIGLMVFSLPGPASGGQLSSTSWRGLLLLVAACSAWAGDNILTRGASRLDPLVVVTIKGFGGGSALLLGTLGASWSLPPRAWMLVMLAGGGGVGLSLVLELLALRRIGAALNAGLFAAGPAFGFLWSLLFLGERAGTFGWLALLSCAAGAVALSIDRHGHQHHHDPIGHTHWHDHLDEHHTHMHGPEFAPGISHVHEHEHEATTHAHPHEHDEHHRHRH